MAARGQPWHSGANYIWWYGIEFTFDPNSTSPNTSLYQTIFSGSRTMSEGPSDVLVQYCLDEWPTDERPLAITQPAKFSTQHANIHTRPRKQLLLKRGTFQILWEDIPYAVQDQMGDPISQSDLGDKNGLCRLTAKEVLPWASDIPLVKVQYLDPIPANRMWVRSSELETRGFLTDHFHIPPCPVRYVNDPNVLGKDLIKVNTHDWFVGVANAGSEGAPFWSSPRFTHNVFTVTVTGWRDVGSYIELSWSVAYDIAMQ